MSIFVLSEKNTQQAKKYAQALFGHTRRNKEGFYEGVWAGNSMVIGYLGGHLYEQYSPADYTDRWNAREAKPRQLIEMQPLVPEKWKIKEKKGKVGKQSIHDLLQKIKRAGDNVTEIYLATDPDREGTLLGREVLIELGLMDKVTSRVYAHDTAESQIRKAFSQAKPIATDELLYVAGLERQRVDWLGGIASFALMKSENALKGHLGKGTGSIGRVKSGVAIFIEQVNQKNDNWDEEAPENNKYGIKMTTSDGLVLKSARQAPLEAQIIGWIKRHSTITTVDIKAEDKKRSVNAPMLLQLSSIMTWAKKNKIKKEIMPFLNNLALKGYITYPRTEINVISKSFRDENLAPRAEEVKNLLEVKLPLPNRLIFDKPWINNKKVDNAGHMANTYGDNVPSKTELESLEKEEQQLYRIIGLRSLAPMMPKGIDSVRQYSSQVDDMPFAASSSSILIKGWRELPELYSNKNQSKKSDEETTFVDGGLKNVNFEVERIKRHPPVRITPANIIELMGKYGLGTSGTRENIIKEMTSFGQIKNNGKYYEVTEVGKALVYNQPLYTFESTKELGKLLLDIQGLGDSETPIPAGTAINKLARDISTWRDAILPKINDTFTYFDPNIEKYKAVERMEVKTKSGKTLKFKKEFFGHTFSEEECEALSQGKEITFKGNNGKPVTGMLKHQTFSGNKFIGFMPNWDSEKYKKAKSVR
ncbi:DNA topoisomerase [Lactococcus allomyrinae]|uniref:Type IA DNA topoisomerase n=1 Tax=Lactococcus allomyrinae TaxID=2419773 RepID=A0A387BG45_9LACT|nr:DNA topoisomerase [Lactococcus allomyrinae]AYF99809.1 type IA DNA topoisomerase [Lactococcus allomyrinae]